VTMKDFVQNIQEYTARGQDWTFTTLTDDGSGASATLVSGTSSYKIKIVGFIVSVDGAGKLDIKLGGTQAIHLEFASRESNVFYVPFPILVTEGANVEATFTADSPTASCYITTIYHMETI